jgi:copper chaperone
MSMEREYTVHGLTCGHCVTAVTQEVGRIAGVEEVDVELDGGRLAVRGTAIEDAAVRAAVEEAGYEVVGERT